MRRILSLIFIVLTMSMMIFAGEIPKEINYPSDKLLLSKNDEILYDNHLYTGKIVFNGVGYDSGYMNLKDGYLEGNSFVENKGVRISLNIVNGKLDGDFKWKSITFDNKDIDVIINFKEGKLNSYVGYEGIEIYNLTFDSNGVVNGTIKNSETGEILNYKDGISETKDGFISKLNTGNKGNELLESVFDKNGKLIRVESKIELIDRQTVEMFWIYTLFVSKNRPNF